MTHALPLAILLLLASPACGTKEQPVFLTIGADFTYPSRRAVVQARSYEELRDFFVRSRLEDTTYPVLKLGIGSGEEGGEYYYLIIPSLSDLPTHSMRAPCPSKVEAKQGCWFIYYTDEEKK